MARTAILAIRIVSDARNAAQGFDQAARGMDRFASGVRAAAGVATVAAGAMVAIGAAAVKSASEAQQAAGAVQSVFGRSASAVQGLADKAASTVGLAASQYNQLAAVLGAQLKNLGVAQDELAGKSDSLIRLGADLAATFGGTTADAVAALGSAFRGEFDPIERYGISIRKSDVNARLAAQGLDKLTGDALKNAEAQAIMAMMTEQSASAQGQFGREADTAAGQQQRLAAEFENAKASIGEGLLPVLTKVAEKFAGMAGWIKDNTTAFSVIAGVVGGLAAALIGLNIAISAYNTIQAVMTAVNAIATAGWWAQAAAVWAATWPILLVIAIIAAVIAIVILVVKNLDTLRRWWDIAFEAGRVAVQWVWDKLKALGSWIAGVFNAAVGKIGDMFRRASDVARKAIELMLTPLNWVIDKVKQLIDWISRISFPDVGGWFGGIFGGNSSASAQMVPASTSRMGLMAAAVPAPMMTTATSTGSGTTLASAIDRLSKLDSLGGTTVYLTVTGAIDPVETGKQVRKALTSTDKSLGGSQAVRLSNRGAVVNNRGR